MKTTVTVACLALILNACGSAGPSGPLLSNSPTASASVEPSPTPSPSTTPNVSAAPPESAAPTPTSPAPDESQTLIVGSTIEAARDGIRIRTKPGTSADALGTVREGAVGFVELGPLPVGGYAWYLITTGYLNTSGVTDGGQGWVASGLSSSPWFVENDDVVTEHGDMTGFAGSGDASVGPVEVDEMHGLRWAASSTGGCGIDIALSNGTERVLVVSTPIMRYGEGGLPVDFFVNNPTLVGSVMIEVQSSCDWAVSVVQFIG